MNSIIKPDGRLTMDDGMGANTTCHPSNSDDLKKVKHFYRLFYLSVLCPQKL